MPPGGRPQVVTAERRIEEARLAKEEKLSNFRDADGKTRKMPVSERDELIGEQFPATRSLNWEKALSNNTDLFARIMRDIIKMDQPRESGKTGPRPNVIDVDGGIATFRQLIGDDFSNAPFIETFRYLTRGHSLRQIAGKTGLSFKEVHRLHTGVKSPKVYDMRVIAEGYKKHPSFFVEYRRNYIIEQLSERLLDEPERITAYYQKMVIQ